MGSSEGNQSAEQFNLVSLDSTNNAKGAFSAYTTYKKEQDEKQMDFNEDEGAPAKKSTIVRKPTPKKESQEPVEDEYEEDEYEEEEVKPKPKAKKKKKKQDVEETIDDILDRLDEVKASLAELFSNAGQTIKSVMLALITPFIPILNFLLKILNIPIALINRITRKLNSRMEEKVSRRSTAPLNKSSAASSGETGDADGVEEAPPEAPSTGFSDMIELNIIFTDNMKKPLYNKNQTRGMGKLGAMEEQLIIDTSITAIKECAEFTAELPSPTSGKYAGQKIFDIMSNVTEQDVKLFLSFVKAYPGKYIGKEWKISETFATWLINNAPTP